MRYILVPTIPIVVGLVAVASFTSPYTAILFLVGFSIASYKCFQFWERHHASEKWDSKLTDERMNEAREEWIREVKNKT